MFLRFRSKYVLSASSLDFASVCGRNIVTAPTTATNRASAAAYCLLMMTLPLFSAVMSLECTISAINTVIITVRSKGGITSALFAYIKRGYSIASRVPEAL